MILKTYAIKDEHNGYATPIPFPNDETAKRYFREMQQENITIRYTPEDFSIWRLGTFNTETGETQNNVTLLERGQKIEK